MATYQPCAFPRRPPAKTSNIFTEIKYQLHLAYYRYEVNTGQYVMSPGEKLAYNLVVLSLLALLFWAIWFCLPRSTILGLQRLSYYLTGRRRALADAMKVVDDVMFQSSGKAVASLQDAGLFGVANSSSTGAYILP